jgi:signal transduction histidine kinase
LGAVALGGITLVVNQVTPTPGYRPGPLIILAAIATGIAILAGRRSATLTTPGMSLLLGAATIGFTVCDYFVGVTQQPYGAMLYVWIGIAAVTFLARRLAVAHLALLAASYAALLVVQRGNAAPFARWAVVIGLVLISAVSVDTLLARLGSLADAERRARIRLESIHRELEAASRHKAEFLATMSHELRTPLNAIIGFSEVLQDELFGPLSDKQREYANDLAEAGHQLLSLVNDILDLAKVDAGRMELDLTEDIDISDPLTLACRAHRPVVVDVVIFELRPIDVDEHKFRRIVDNLIDEVADIAKVERIVVTAETSAEALTIDVVADGVIRLDTGVVPLRVAVAAALTELHGGGVETRPGGWRVTMPLRALSREPV